MPGVIKEEQIAGLSLGEKRRKTLVNTSRRRLRVFQKNDLFPGYALLSKEIHQLRVATVRLRKRCESVGVLELEQADNENPGVPWLPFSSAGRRRLCQRAAGNDQNRKEERLKDSPERAFQSVSFLQCGIS